MATNPEQNSLQLKVITSESDIPELARVKEAAFRDSPFHTAMYPIGDQEAMLAFHEARELLGFSNPRKAVVAVVDTSRPGSPVLAFARWFFPLRIINEERAASGDAPLPDTSSAPKKSPVEAPEGTNVAFRSAFLGWWDSLHDTHGISEQDYELITLATHPDARGKGCASMLLKWGIEHAERNKSRIALSSTPVAHGLYQKHGWRDIDQRDFAEYGAPIINAMIREPQRV